MQTKAQIFKRSRFQTLSITGWHCIRISFTSIHYTPKEFQCKSQTVVTLISAQGRKKKEVKTKNKNKKNSNKKNQLLVLKPRLEFLWFAGLVAHCFKEAFFKNETLE